MERAEPHWTAWQSRLCAARQEEMPKFADGTINLRELAESMIDAVMDAEAEEMLGIRQQQERIPPEDSQHLRRDPEPQDPQVQEGELLP